jgi:hypothetical protein
MQKIHYIYLTINLITGEKYIGDRSINKEPERDNYLGSGKLIKEKIKEYGRENFKKEILEKFSSKKEAFNAQEKYIKLYKSHISEGGYNISKKGGLCVKGCLEHTKETKIKIGKACKGKSSSKKYTLIDPNGKEYRNVCLITICKENNLNFYTLRKHINYGKIKIKKTYNIKESTLNCENWQVFREGKIGRRIPHLWILINPNNEEFPIYKNELMTFIESHNLDWRILNRRRNMGKIKIKNKTQCYEKTLNTEGWEFKNYTKWANNSRKMERIKTFYHGTSIENWEKINQEKIFWGVKGKGIRINFLTPDIKIAKLYGKIILVMDLDIEEYEIRSLSSLLFSSQKESFKNDYLTYKPIPLEKIKIWKESK